MNRFFVSNSFLKIKAFRLIVCLLIGSLLAACQTAPKSPAEPKEGWSNESVLFEKHRAWRTSFNQWELSAKVGIRVGEVRESANLVWRANGDAHQMRLFGPLGAGATRLEFDADSAILKDSKGRVYRDSDAENLLYRVVGWPIPLTNLQEWVFALPVEQNYYQYIAEGGQLQVLEQAGWRIEYSSYKPYMIGAPNLPRKITATKTADFDGQKQVVTVRLIVKSWSQ